MTRDKLRLATEAAQRFLIAVEPARDRLLEQTLHPYDHNVVGTKETAAARRASMDLTRALAQLRAR